MPARWLVPALLLVSALACSGSSSESPWPAEPLDRYTDPVGEEKTDGNAIDPSKLEDRYSPGVGGGGGGEVDLDKLDRP